MTPSNDTTALRLPRLAPVYAIATPLAETWLRVICGITLMVHGWPKVQAPLGMTGMVEGLGFYPGWFWAPALAFTEFLGGLLLVLGLFTRPAALAVSIVLLVTVWVHWVSFEQGFSGAELSLIWSAATLFFAARGARTWSLDRVIGREF